VVVGGLAGGNRVATGDELEKPRRPGASPPDLRGVRRRTTSVLAAVLAVAALAHPCKAPLPRAPAVPAAIVLRTSCGAFLLRPDGSVARLPRHWLARHSGGTGRLWGAHLNLRRNRAGRYFLLFHGRMVWRSHGLYPNDGGSVAFGPHRFAFASYRRGVFVTDLRARERLVVAGRGLGADDFTRSGELLVNSSHAITLVSPRGDVLRRLAFRARNGFALDHTTDSLYFVTPAGVLARVDGTRVTLLRRVPDDGWMSLAPHLIVFAGPHSIVVTRRDGSRVAATRWPRRLENDSGVRVAPGGRAFAFRLSDLHAGATSGRGIVYVLRAGAVGATAVYRGRLGPAGCGYGANLSWNRHSLLYDSSDGSVAIITGGSRPIDLTRLAATLPRRSSGERALAAWRSEFPQ